MGAMGAIKWLWLQRLGFYGSLPWLRSELRVTATRTKDEGPRTMTMLMTLIDSSWLWFSHV